MPMSGCDRWLSFGSDRWSRGGKTLVAFAVFNSNLFGLFLVPAGRPRSISGGRIFPILPANDFGFPLGGSCLARPAHGLFGCLSWLAAAKKDPRGCDAVV